MQEPCQHAEFNDFINECFSSIADGYSGKGAQDNARTIGEFILQLNPRKAGGTFHGFRTASDARRFAEKMSELGHDVNERIDGSKPCRPFVDFDFKIENGYKPDLSMVITAMKEQLKEMSSRDTRICVYTYSTDCKLSAHLLACDVHVANGLMAKKFAEDVRARLPDNLQSAVDCIGNLKSFGLRLPYCPKDGDATRQLERLQDSTKFDYLLQDGSTRQIIGKLDLVEKPIIRSELTENAKLLVEKVATTFKWFGPPDLSSTVGFIVATFPRIRDTYCTSCNRSHDRKGAYIAVSDDGSAYLRCYDAPAGSNVLYSIGGKMKELPLDSFDQLENATIVNGKYNADVIADDYKSDLYISSAWGTGKSHHNNKMIKNLLSRNKKALVLIVSARKSLSTQMVNDFGAVSYTKIKGMLDVNYAPVSVWQLESLSRVDTDQKFDLILLDELTALANHAYHQSGSRARAGFSSLRQLVKNASRVIVSDNDLTSEQVLAVKTIRTVPALVIRNEYQPWTNTTASFYCNYQGIATIENKMWNRLGTQHKNRKDGKEWHGTIIACHSKKRAMDIEREACECFGRNSVILYTGETCDKQKARDFSNATDAWKNALVIIYTSTVSVGVSDNSPHIDTVFAYYINGNTCAATAAQMLFRARQVKDIHILYTQSKCYGLPRTRDALLKWATLAHNRLEIPDEFRDDRTPTIKEQSSKCPKALSDVVDGFEGRIWVNAKIEQMRSQSDFAGRLKSILTRAGLTIIIAAKNPEDDRVEKPTSGEIPEIPREANMIIQIPDAIARLDNDEMHPDREKTKNEKAGDRAVWIAESLKVDVREITEDWILGHEQHVDVYRRLCRIISHKTFKGDVFKTNSEAEACHLSIKVLTALGLDVHTLRSGESVSSNTLKIAAELCADEINKHALRLYNDHNAAQRKKAKTSNFRTWIGLLTVPLKYLGIDLIRTYANIRDETKGQNPTGLILRYVWEMNTAAPIVKHPADVRDRFEA